VTTRDLQPAWKHARTSQTPEYPRWRKEGSTCPHRDCSGRLTTYKIDSGDPGVDTPAEYRQTTSTPHPAAWAGDWICAACGSMGPIALSEVDLGDVDNVITFPLSRVNHG